MAGVLARSMLNLARRPSLMVSTMRGAQKMMADPMEHATGLERKELEAIAKGNPDPFQMSVQKKGAGTRDSPTLVPSFHEMRLVGCCCHEDTFYVNFLWLYKGDNKRCECGHWYKLIEAKDPFK